MSSSPVNGASIYDYLGPLGKAFKEVNFCIENPSSCLTHLMSYAAYEMPKNALEFASSTFFWGGKKIFDIGAYTLEYLDISTEEKCAAAFSQFYEAVSSQANKLSIESTSWVTNKTIEEITKEFLKYDEELKKYNNAEDILSQPNVPFKSVQLLGASLLMNYLAKKTFENFCDAGHHLKLLLTLQFRLTYEKKIASPNPTMIGGNTVNVYLEKDYSLKQLLTDIGKETFVTAFCSGLFYLSYNGMFNEIYDATINSEEASSINQNIALGLLNSSDKDAFLSRSSEHALFVTRTLSLVFTLGPTIYRIFKEAYNYKPETSYENNETSKTNSLGISKDTDGIGFPGKRLTIENSLDLLRSYRDKGNT